MQPIDQSFFIAQLENEVENQLQEVIEVFQNLPETTLLQPSPTGGWSIAQCFEHLNSYSAFYFPRLNKALEKASESSNTISFKHTWIGSYFINMMNTAMSNKKYKAMKKHRPNDMISNPHQSISTFIQHLEDLLMLMKASRKKDWKKVFITTSLSNWLKINTGDAIQFVLTHNRRHIEQAKRNL